MSHCTRSSKRVSMGLDLGDRQSYLVGVTRDGEIVLEEKIRTTREHFGAYFAKVRRGTRVVCEAGTHSPWVSALLEGLGLDVVVANPVHVGRALAANGRKNDRLDAITLATLGRDSLRLLRQVKHRGPEAQNDLAVIRARDAAVRCRTVLINAVRGLVKTSGERLPSCSTASFHRKVAGAVPAGLKPALDPLIEQIAQLTESILHYDKLIEELCKKYPETERLRAIKGVGALTALAFVLCLERAERFERSRSVGAYVGLTPGEHASGASSPQLRITKAGDDYLRRLLVGAAHYILGPFGEDCDLKRFGERLSRRGGARGKKQAAVAVARKLAVLMHTLWAKQLTYDPLYNSSQLQRSA
jgi:transposase